MELFDKYGRFQMPDTSEIASLDPATQERFAAIQEAAAELENVTAKRHAAEQAVNDTIAERDESEKELRTLRPKLDRVAVAKDWIASQRAL